MRELFIEFLKSPSRETYLAVHDAVSSSEQYEPYSDAISRMQDLIDQERYEEARALFSESTPNLILSPRIHLLMSQMAENTGDEKGAQMESFIASTCLEGILATGDGSMPSPYVVLHTSDEYDVLMYLGKEFRQQALVEVKSRHYDVMTCADRSELWFDITSPYDRLNQKCEGSKKA